LSANIKELLEAGAHFGHPTSRWHPKMQRYIFTKRNGIHIIDLEQTAILLDKACDFIKEQVSLGARVLFVGTKKQAQDIVAEEAARCGMFYVNQRWIGGTLTNFQTIQSRIDYLVRLEDQQERGDLSRLPKKEVNRLNEEVTKLNRLMGGFKEMTSLPDIIFIIDPSKERNALIEAKKIKIPIVAMVDTNCNPDEINYPIPANDDAMRTIKLIMDQVADTILEARAAEEATEEQRLAAQTASIIEDEPEEEITENVPAITTSSEEA
jgi:small subunit ribosomal protein S2